MVKLMGRIIKPGLLLQLKWIRSLVNQAIARSRSRTIQTKGLINTCSRLASERVPDDSSAWTLYMLTFKVK